MAESDVEKIKDRLSINEVVGQYVSLKRAGRNFTARCPFHKEKTPSFFVSPERGSYICFGCGEKGDIFSFVQKIEAIDFPTALRQLAEKAGVTLERSSRSPEATAEPKEKDERLRELCEEATLFFEIDLKKRKDVEEYLRSRGVEDETKKSWRIGYAPASWETLARYLATKGYSKDEIVDAGFGVRSQKKPGEIFDRFRGRIMFPLFDAGGKVIAFSGRFFESVAGTKDDIEPAKYVNSPETSIFKKSRVLYGLDRAKNAIRKADCILLVEGQFDVILCHQSGLPFTVAISGTALTQEHLSLLGRLSKRLILALDADAAGIRAGLKSAEMALASGFDVKIPSFPVGRDPADMAKENPELLKAAVRTSYTAVEFFLEVLRPQARDERAFKKLIEQSVLPLIKALQSSIDQEHFIRIVASRLGVSEGAIRIELAKRPSIKIDEPEPSSIDRQGAVLSVVERAAGMLLYHFESDEAMRERLNDLLGKERVLLIQEKNKDDAERLRFEFEALGEEEATISEALLNTIERTTLEEEMQNVRHSLHINPTLHGELGKKLADLKRRQEELRR